VANYFGSAILSTNKGLMASKKAMNLGLGGEVVATIF